MITKGKNIFFFDKASNNTNTINIGYKLEDIVVDIKNNRFFYF